MIKLMLMAGLLYLVGCSDQLMMGEEVRKVEAIHVESAVEEDSEDSEDSEESLLSQLMNSGVRLTPGFSVDDFLEDFDYMIKQLHRYYPFLGVLDRTHGVDINELAQANREIIQRYYSHRSNNLSPTDLAWLLDHYFLPYFNGMGHLSVSGIPGGTTSGPASGVVVVEGRVLAETRTMTTKVIEEGRIAYIHASSFMERTSGQFFRDFFEYIGDFEHLIIDLRGNAGGFPMGYIAGLIEPLLVEDRYIESLAFVTQLQHGEERIREAAWMHHGRVDGSMNTGFRPVDELLPIVGLTRGEIADIDSFIYGSRFVYSFTANRRRNPETFNVEVAPLFAGKVWLIIEEVNASASSMFARFMRDLELATLVGQQQRGALGGWRTGFYLPHTNMRVSYDAVNLSNSAGVSFEEDLVGPHIVTNIPMTEILRRIEAGEYE